jgi:uncharacterized protein DUF4197
VRKIAAVAMAVVLFGGVAHARFPDIKSLLRTAPASTSTSNVSDEKAAAGQKEALQVSAGNAVTLTGKVDGFFGNDAIRILMPEKLKTVWPHADPKTGTYPISSGAERRSAIREMGYVPI